MPSELVSRILSGDEIAAARLISALEDENPEASEYLKELYPYTGKAYVVGVTGAPGVGKSTLIDSIIGVFITKKVSLGIIAIDPSSSISGGALLGDRLRMRKNADSNDVFIRSLATRGWIGGLTKATASSVQVIDALGKDIIIIETAGAGQTEIDIIKVSDTSLLVLSPDMGDEVQAMKAGIMELADILVVNKTDKDSAEGTKQILEAMLETKDYPPGKWRPPVVLTNALNNKGVKALVDAIVRHREFITSTGELKEKRLTRARLELFKRTGGPSSD